MPDPILHSRPMHDRYASCAVCREPLPDGRPLERTSDGDGATCSALCRFRDSGDVVALREALEDGADVGEVTLTVETDPEGLTSDTLTGELAEGDDRETVVVLGCHEDANGREWEDPSIEWAHVTDARAVRV